MRKKFNITGNCHPTKHYMADVSEKLKQTLALIEDNEYFIINRPRQYGKTTTLYSIEHALMLKGDYLVFNISFEGIGDAMFEDEKVFAPGFIRLLQRQVNYHTPSLLPYLKEKEKEVNSLDSLSEGLADFMLQTKKKVVLLIDEVDKSSNNQLFVSFLAMLRNKYLEREKIKTFHAVVLAGVHDVKTLKLRIRPDSEQKYNSPWNIAAEYKVDMNLHPQEIKPMLEEYASDKGVRMDTQKIAERLFYYTSGYPFLVSKLCKMLDEGDSPLQNEREWTDFDLEIAVQELIKQENTNFDALIKNLENNEELYQLIYQIAVNNQGISFNIHNPIIKIAVLYGIITEKTGKASIHNRVYNELIVNYMTNKMELYQISTKKVVSVGYKNDDGSLNMASVLLGFQEFMKKEYNKKDRDFLEKNGRLVFLAFLKPIINGVGYDFKEPQISDEKRLDVVITYLREKYIVELKVWYGEKAHEKGIKQLTDYLDRQHLEEGYLLIFDHSEVKNWKTEWIEANGKRILAAWV
jgi:hypothetical protein